MFLDKYGLIVQSNGDGGDSAQRMGMWWCAQFMLQKLNLNYPYLCADGNDPCSLDKTVSVLLTSKGLIRNPAPGTSAPYWNDPTYTSRDQTIPMIMATGLWKLDQFKIDLEIMKPGLTYPNFDPAGPEDWNLFYRAWGAPGMPLGDGQALGQAILRCHQASEDQDDVGDDLNTMLSLVVGYVSEPSPATKAPLFYYLTKRPPSFGTTQLGVSDPVLGALAWYFRPAAGGNPECAEIWNPIITQLRGDLGCPI